MRLDVPFYRQRGPNCWYYAMKMVRDYHKRGEPKYQAERQLQIDNKVAVSAGAIGQCNNITADIVLVNAGLWRLGKDEFNQNTDGSALVNLLFERGPLFLPLWSDNHAQVIVGADQNMFPEEFNGDPWIVWLHDPGLEEGYDVNGLHLVKKGLWDIHKDENPWAFQRKFSKHGTAVDPRQVPLLG